MQNTAVKLPIAQRKQIIQDKAKRINLKSKRTRTLIRKAIEVSQMCNLDIHIVLKDRDFNKVIEYNSISNDGFIFTIDHAKALLDQLKVSGHRRNYKLLTDDDYENLKVHPRGGDFLDQESLYDLPVRVQDLITTAALPDASGIQAAAT